MCINAEHLGQLDQPIRLLMTSTLHHQRGPINPYADRGMGPVRLTAISDRAKGFWQSLPGLLRGRLHDSKNPSVGYLSGRCKQLTLSGLVSACIDGQESEFCPDEPVTIRADSTFRFLVR